jgi:hypothetical protein
VEYQHVHDTGDVDVDGGVAVFKVGLSSGAAAT